MHVGEGASDIVDVSHNCLALDKVLYEGHAVAAVAATSPEIAREALGLIDVEYEVLPHVLGLERSEEHPSELQSLMRTSDAVSCLKKKKNKQKSVSSVTDIHKTHI